jgi:hypothetical protein
MKTLEEVVDFYDKGGRSNKNLDEKIDGAPIVVAVPTCFPQ